MDFSISPQILRKPDNLPPAPAAKFQHRRNGFDLIRLLAATLVIYGHSFPLSNTPGPGYLANSLQTVAVKVFFVTSGFLICRSWLSDPHPLRYLTRRALRILPGLILVVLLSIALLGPALTSLPVSAYLANTRTWAYLSNILLYPRYDLPGVFNRNAYPGAINGSLWTIPVEVFMDVLLPFVIGFKPQRAKLALLLATATFFSFHFLYLYVDRTKFPHVIYGTDVVNASDVSVYFMVGSVYATFALDRFARPLLSVLLLILPGLFFYNRFAGEGVLLITLPFLVISIGTLHLPWFDRIFHGNDLSYGLYLYAFPIQQAIQSLSRNRVGFLKQFLVAVPLAALCAWFSWILVEKRALSAKPQRRSVLPGIPQPAP